MGAIADNDNLRHGSPAKREGQEGQQQALRLIATHHALGRSFQQLPWTLCDSLCPFQLCSDSFYPEAAFNGTRDKMESCEEETTSQEES